MIIKEKIALSVNQGALIYLVPATVALHQSTLNSKRHFKDQVKTTGLIRAKLMDSHFLINFISNAIVLMIKL